MDRCGEKELLHEVLQWMAMVDLSQAEEIRFAIDDCMGTTVTVEFKSSSEQS